MVEDPRDAGPAAQTLEALGYDGGFVFEGRHDPFLQTCVMAERTERIEIMTAIAVAFARNPMNLANIGYDLQLHSKGRFVLGLGSQIKPHIERRFSMPWSSPAARMREMITAIRAIWNSWQQGEKLDHRGEFYQHTLMAPFFNPGPNPYGLPPIFLAGVGPVMTRVAGEVADGYFLHPFHTEAFLADITIPALEEGWKRAGRKRENFEVSAQVIVVSGKDDAALSEAKQGAKSQVSFYGSTPAYKGVFESVGRDELHPELKALSKRGGWLEMADQIDDELLDQIAIVGPLDEIARRVHERYGKLADRVSLIGYGLDDEQKASLIPAIRAS
ncbi:MAG: TIGR03617 family F420-dependent LLM class oxidoreductase [bacterium]|nr:TIGR03617 family F420-dependent LLM class oxidoreductase [bacterium]